WRLVAPTRGLGPPRVRLPRDPRAVVRGHLLRELLSERARPRAALAAGGRRAVPPPSGRRRRVSAHRRSRRAARARRPLVPHNVLDGALPSGDAAPRPRRDRADLALRGADRSVRKEPGCGMRDAGSVVKTYTIAVLPGDGIGPEVIAEAERTLEAVGDRFEIAFTLRRFPIGAAGVAAAGDPFPGETRAAVARADAVLLGAGGEPSLDQAPRPLRPEFGLLALRAQLGVYANLPPVAVVSAPVARSS